MRAPFRAKWLVRGANFGTVPRLDWGCAKKLNGL
jgi:hypothetical protein